MSVYGARSRGVARIVVVPSSAPGSFSGSTQPDPSGGAGGADHIALIAAPPTAAAPTRPAARACLRVMGDDIIGCYVRGRGRADGGGSDTTLEPGTQALFTRQAPCTR